MKATDSRQRTVPVTWATSARTISPESLTGLASTLATTGTAGGFTATSASACAMTSAAGCISAQWNGAETGSIIELEPEQRRHGAGADRHRLLHGATADAHETCGIGDRERAGGGKRRIFAERMTGHELRVARETDARLGFQHSHRRERDRHQCRLRVLGERQRLGRPFPDDLGELLAERRIHLLEDLPRRRKGVGQRLAHADRLAALPREYESDRHAPNSLEWRMFLSANRFPLRRDMR